MGLCKCPKRKVTNQFCFEHRVNVCEHCMVKKHPKCVVQSYLQWLQDSDYNPNCLLCDQDLSEENCARLKCYHVFHWVCLDRYARNLPGETAPAGYTCPTCQDCIFAPENLVSPVADELKKLLSNVNWARAGLGLPLLEEQIEKRPTFNAIPTGPRPTPEGESLPTRGPIPDGVQSVGINASSLGNNQLHPGIGHRTNETEEHVVQFDGSSPTSRMQSRELPTSPLLLDRDADDDKYKRRSAVSFLSRWWRSTIGPTSRGKRWSSTQRQLVIAFVVFVGFVSLMFILSHLGRNGYDSDYISDPMLDPMNNPNIHVKEA